MPKCKASASACKTGDAQWRLTTNSDVATVDAVVSDDRGCPRDEEEGFGDNY